MRDMLSQSQSTAASEEAPSRKPGLIQRARERVRAWMEVRAASAADAALYQELSRLSDAELERRGIPRGELYRCISRHSE